MRIVPIASLLVVGPLACKPIAAAPAIPPPAAAIPLALDELEEEDEWLDEEPPAPRGSCERAPKSGIAEPDFGPTRELIGDVMKWMNAPSIAVAVARDGKVLWEEGFGFADPRRRVRADEHTMYSLASISKPFTSTGMMVLVERGQLDLATPLGDALPEPGLRPGVGDPAAATLLRVASHTAGLPLHYQFYYADRDAKVPSLEQTRRDYAVTVIEPGQRYQYSNLGYGLLGQVIEHASGKPYAEFMRTEVFEPLDLRHTFVGKPPRRAGTTAPRVSGRGNVIADYGFDHDGASALYSSAHDLVRFGMFHIGAKLAEQREILSLDARRAMQRPVPPAEGYGLGWGLGLEDSVVRVSHNGGMPGVRTLLTTFPEQGVVIVVLVNSDGVGREHQEIGSFIQHALGLPARSDDVCMLPLEHELLGSWQGVVHTVAGERRFVLDVRETGEVTAAFGDHEAQIVRGVRVQDGVLVGHTTGDVAAELAEGKVTPLQLELRLRNGRLEGGVSAMVPWVSATTLLAVLEPAG